MQDLACGTVISKNDVSSLQQFKSARLAIPSTQTRYFPIQHHIVRRSDGVGGLSTSAIEQIMAELNDSFSGANIQFYTCSSINYIDSDAFYNFSISEESSLISTHNDSNEINVYYFNSVDSYCGYTYLPTTNRNIIAMRNSCATNGSTLIHEFGHFFWFASYS